MNCLLPGPHSVSLTLVNLSNHTVQELSWYFLNCVKGSEGTMLTLTMWGTTPNVPSNHRFLVF